MSKSKCIQIRFGLERKWAVIELPDVMMMHSVLHSIRLKMHALLRCKLLATLFALVLNLFFYFFADQSMFTNNDRPTLVAIRMDQSEINCFPVA